MIHSHIYEGLFYFIKVIILYPFINFYLTGFIHE